MSFGWMRSRSLGSICAGIPTTGSTGFAVIAGLLFMLFRSKPVEEDDEDLYADDDEFELGDDADDFDKKGGDDKSDKD